MLARDYSVDELLANSWDKKLANDLAAEIEVCTGENRGAVAVEEMRRFLAVKGYRELLKRIEDVRRGKTSHDALKAVALEMRGYALQRPALSAAAFRIGMADSPEWRHAHANIHAFMMTIFEECGLTGEAAEDALLMLRSLVRGFVLNELMHSVLGVRSYDDCFEDSIRVMIAGLPALIPSLDPGLQGPGC
jgi:hypothetical protein